MTDPVAAGVRDLQASIDRAKLRGLDTADLVATLAELLGNELAARDLPPAKLELMLLAVERHIRRAAGRERQHEPAIYKSGDALRRRRSRR